MLLSRDVVRGAINHSSLNSVMCLFQILTEMLQIRQIPDLGTRYAHEEISYVFSSEAQNEFHKTEFDLDILAVVV